MEAIYNLSTIGLVIVIIIGIIGLIRPTTFKSKLGKYATRKHIAVGGVAAFILLSGIVGVTEPASVKQARLDRERAQQQAQQAKAAAEASNAKITEAKSQPETKTITEKESITFSKERRNDATLPAGQTKIIQTGKNGEKTSIYEVTYTDGKETARVKKSETTTLAAVAEITAVGTHVAPAPKAAAPTYQAPQSSGRTGAICKDGTRSNATGRGACSHHGGVATWIYN